MCCGKPYNLVLDGGCSASTIPEEVLLRIGNDCLKLKTEEKQFGLTGLVKYHRGVDMSGLTGPMLKLSHEAWVRWELPGADGRSVFIEVKHRVLPKGTSNPRNILISASVLEALGHAPLKDGHFFRNHGVMTSRAELLSPMDGLADTVNVIECCRLESVPEGGSRVPLRRTQDAPDLSDPIMAIKEQPHGLDVHITAEPAFAAIRAPTKPLAASAFPSPALSHDSPFLRVPRPVLAGVITGLAKQDLVRLCSVARRALQLRPLAKQVEWELGDHSSARPLCALCGYTIGGILSWKLHFGPGGFLHYGCGQQAGCLLPPPVAPPSQPS